MIEVFTAWPVPVALAAASAVSFLLFLVRDPLRSFVGRITKLRAGPVTARAPQEAGAAPPGPLEQVAKAERGAAGEPDPKRIADIILGRIEDPHFLEVEAGIERGVAAGPLGNDPEQLLRVAKRLWAYWLAIAVLERIYGLIFGTQIALLRTLNTGPMDVEAIQQFYEASASDLPFDTWLGYLLAEGLAAREEDAISITAKGAAFLHFLVNFHKPDREL